MFLTLSLKAVVFHDFDIETQIMSTDDPREQKRLGKMVTGFSNDVWLGGGVACQIVYEANMAKVTSLLLFLKAYPYFTYICNTCI